MGINKGMMVSDSSEWETPQEFYDRLDAIYRFTLDVAATPENAKCEAFYTEEDDALGLAWPGRVWCNPPYGRQIPKWAEKGYKESCQPYNRMVVMLLAARTDTRWWHEWVMRAETIWLVKGRLTFVGAPNAAPFPSAVAVFKGLQRVGPKFKVLLAKES